MKIAFLRAADHDVTQAIPRAIEAAAGTFSEMEVLCWGSHGVGEAATPPPAPIRSFGPESWSRRRRLRFPLFMVWLGLRLLRDRPDVVQACDLLCAAPAGIACRLYGATLVYDMRDPAAESFAVSRLVRRLVYSVDWLVMGLSHAFVVPAASRVAYLGRWGSRRPVAVIHNTCADERDRLLADRPATQNRSGSPLRLAYLGYVVETRGARWLMESCRASGGALELHAAGTCTSASLREALADTDGVHWHGRLPRDEALRLMIDADAVLLLYDPRIPVNRRAAPNKYYEALMTGTPVLVSRGMELAEEVQSAGVGAVVEYGDTDDLLRVADEWRDPERLRELGDRCRRYFVREHAWETQRDRYADFYADLVTTRPRLMPDEGRP